MYYLAFFFLIATAICAARLAVATIGRLNGKWLRRLTFWLIAVPVGLGLIVAASLIAGDDNFFIRSPRAFLAVMMPPIIFLLTLLCYGFSGSRLDSSTSESRARTWPLGRNAKRLGICVVLFALSIPLFHWQLLAQLTALKSEALATIDSMSQTTIPDVDNAAVMYAKLDQWDTLLNQVKELVEVQTVDEHGNKISAAAISLRLLPVDRLQECEPAFDILRSGSRLPGLSQSLERSDVNGMIKETDTTALGDAMSLLRFSALLKMERGDSKSACDDVRVLLRIGTQFEQGVQTDGRECGDFAHHLASGCLAAMLRSERKVSDNDLRSFVRRSAGVENSIYNGCRWMEAVNTVKLCNIYLDPQTYEQDAYLWSHDFPFGQFGFRLAYAQDDMTALRIRNDFYRPFSKRLDKSQANMDEIPGPFNRLWTSIPIGKLRLIDTRDWLLLSASAGADSRSLTSLMAAVTLFERQHDRYPKTVTELVPEFLAIEPISRRDGMPFRLVPTRNGLVICSSPDERKVLKVLDDQGTIQRDTLPRLEAAQFLGEAYDQAHGLNANGGKQPKE